MGYEYVPCRSNGHEWHHQRKLLDGLASGVIGLVSTCGTCGMERTRWVARSGQAQPARYRAPEGYRTTGDERRTTQQWRREFVATIFDGTPTRKAKR